MFKENDYPVIESLDKIIRGRGYHSNEEDEWDEKYGTEWIPELSKRLICPDGFSISVQASSGHYCRPRDSYGPYSHVELGFPENMSKRDRGMLAPHWEKIWDDQIMEKSVFPYMPANVVRDIIVSHCTYKSSLNKHVALGVLLVFLTMLIYVLASI